jgi:probable HAF family extracellular repeat protein
MDGSWYAERMVASRHGRRCGWRAACGTVAAIAAVAFALVAGASAAHAARSPYRLRDLGTPSGADSYATAINRWGTVVGYSVLPTGRQRGFVWRPRTGMVAVPLSRVSDINDRGQMVGFRYVDPRSHDGESTIGYVVGGGTPLTQVRSDAYLPCETSADVISNTGLVAGSDEYCDGGSFIEMFLWRRGSLIGGWPPDCFIDGVSGVGCWIESTASAADAAGDIVGSGQYWCPNYACNVTRGFLRMASGAVLVLPTLSGSDADYVAPTGINRAGTLITGTSGGHAVEWTPDGAVRALAPDDPATVGAGSVNDCGDVILLRTLNGYMSQYSLLHNGHRYSLARLLGSTDGYTYFSVVGLNDRGQIAATATAPGDGKRHALLLEPRKGERRRFSCA